MYVLDGFAYFQSLAGSELKGESSEATLKKVGGVHDPYDTHPALGSASITRNHNSTPFGKSGKGHDYFLILHNRHVPQTMDNRARQTYRNAPDWQYSSCTVSFSIKWLLLRHFRRNPVQTISDSYRPFLANGMNRVHAVLQLNRPGEDAVRAAARALRRTVEKQLH